jgi:hypothetical protein
VRYNKYILSFLLALLFVLPAANVRAEDAAESKSEQFNPTPMVMHHIADSHEWDILEMAQIPLPCILYSSSTA